MSPTTTPPPDRRPWNDPRGWLALAWVVAWSAAYVHSALGERFPWIRTWVDGLL
ncbi:hypothetical protein [Paludisphaera sp.]|uniref:hypothetical protein n=1 Tax=Paludisphaera sp. TaxID=2017432 RepID=UPI00301CCD76